MLLLDKVKRICNELTLNHQTDDDGHIILVFDLEEDGKARLVLTANEQDQSLAFTSINVFNTNDYAETLDKAELYQHLLQFNWKMKIGALQRDTDGEVRFEYTLLTSADNLQLSQVDYCIRAVVAATARIRETLRELPQISRDKAVDSATEPAASVEENRVPEALRFVYDSHISIIQSDSSSLSQLNASKAVLEGFLTADFSAAFNQLLREDLAKLGAKLDRLVPTEF